MSHSTIASFDSTVHLSNSWLKELSQEFNWPNGRTRAYAALRAVLHALRDRLTVEEAVDLAAQLPMLIRGFYYEGWRPGVKPAKDYTKAQFLAHVAAAFPELPPQEVEEVARAVFRLLAHRITGGEIDDIKNSLPGHIRELWD